MAYPLSDDEFLTRLQEWHPDRFDVLTPFGGMHSPITVKCRVCGLVSEHRRAQTLRKSRGAVGCYGCRATHLSRVKTWSHDEYVAALEYRHPNITLTALYVHSLKPISYRCECGNERTVKAAAYLLSSGCGECRRSDNAAPARIAWLKRHRKDLMRRTRGRVTYVSGFVSPGNDAVYECTEHGQFTAKPASMNVLVYACSACALAEKPNTIRENATYRGLKQIAQVHVGRVKVLRHAGMSKRAELVCDNGHYWSTTLSSVARGHGCRICNAGRFSVRAIMWLEKLARILQQPIAHAGNTGEVRLRGTTGKTYFADGFLKNSSILLSDGSSMQGPTVFEFYGDVFHGNPTRYASDDVCFTRDGRIGLAGQLYLKVIERELDILKAGYNLVAIWESDFLADKIYSHYKVYLPNFKPASGGPAS